LTEAVGESIGALAYVGVPIAALIVEPVA